VSDIWEKIRSIRQSWRDPKKLNVLLDEWERRFGDAYNQIVEELVAEHTRSTWAKISSQNEVTSLDALISILWEEWTEGEFSIERTETEVQIYCTKCPIADAYKSINKENYGILFHCNRILLLLKDLFQKVQTYKNTYER